MLRYLARARATKSRVHGAPPYCVALARRRDRQALRCAAIACDGMLHGSAVAVEPQRVSVATGGYHEEALRVAKVSRRHGKVVDICLHHVAGGAGGAEALAYIATLGRAEQEALLVQHGKALVSRFKLEMQARLELCAALCTTAPSCAVHNGDQLNCAQWRTAVQQGQTRDAGGVSWSLCCIVLRSCLRASRCAVC